VVILIVVIEKNLRLTVEYESGTQREAWSVEAANFHGLLRRADLVQSADSQEKMSWPAASLSTMTNS